MRRFSLVLLVAAFAALTVAASAHAAVLTHRTGESPATVRKYWTADRMQRAQPVDFAGRTGEPRDLRRGNAGGGGSGSSAATSVEVTIPAGSPLTAQGKVFFSAGKTNYVCSGTALQGNVVWTAGHCVNQGPGAYYTNFVFVPAYRDGAAPYGKFPASSLLTTDGWRLTGQFGVDSGAAIPTTNAAGQTLVQAVVERAIAFNSPRNQSYSVYGYPAARPFNGQRLRVCNTAWSRNDASTAPAAIGVPCDMTGGSSGGGWITATGNLVGNVSYGYSSLKNVLFGPHLEAEAQALYTAAVAAPH